MCSLQCQSLHEHAWGTPADLDVYNLQTALMTSLATDTVILPPIEAAPSKVLKVLRQVTKLLWIAETAPINRQQLFLASGISARVPDTGPRNLYFDAGHRNPACPSCKQQRGC